MASRNHASIAELVGLDTEIDQKGWADHMVHGRALLTFAGGDPVTALVDPLKAGERHEAFLATCPSEFPWRSDAALCHIATGDSASARALACEEVGLARSFGAPRALGIALRVLGSATGSPDAFEESLAVLATSPAKLELARTLVDYGEFLAASGDLVTASARLADGCDLAARLGATALVDRANRSLAVVDRNGVRLATSPASSGNVTSRSPLSSAELRVVHLATRGMSNPEIARVLFLNRRTVESHLYNSYKKLGIGSRSEVAEALESQRKSVASPLPDPPRRPQFVPRGRAPSPADGTASDRSVTGSMQR